MTITRTERPTGTPGSGIGVDTLTRPADLTADQLALTHQSAAGMDLAADGAAATQNRPVLHPPGTAGAATASTNLAGTWQSKQVLALFATRNSRNGWAYLDGVGWRKLATSNDSAHIALGMLASASRLSGKAIVARDEADGQIHEIYLW